MLAKRLTRRGLALSGASLTLAVGGGSASASVPASLISVTTRAAGQLAAGKAAATGIMSARVVAITEGVIKAMLLTNLKITTAVVLSLGLAATTVGLAGQQAFQAQRPEV